MNDTERGGLVNLATEYWRLLRLLERTISEGPPEKIAKGDAQLRYGLNRLVSILADHGVRMVTYDNQPFEPNLPVTVSNADESSVFDDPVVDKTLEPTFVMDGRVLAMGKVLIRNRT